MSRSEVNYLTTPTVVLSNTHTRQLPEVKFGVPASEALKDDHLPIPLADMLVYIAQEGVTTTDLFRRPGNPSDAKVIIKKLTDGKEVTFTNYNFYTLATVIKKFLLKLPGGVFGPEVERKFLSVLDIPQRVEQYEELNKIILSLPPATQQLLALLFGTWFRIVNHSEFNTMSSEAVAKSVAGSLFHTCSDDPKKVEKAVEVLQILIDDFGVSNMFGRRNIQYFAEMTRTGIRVKEKYKFEYKYPTEGSVPYEKSVGILAGVLQQEAQKRGFDVKENAISEEDFYGRPPRSRAGTGEAAMRLGAGPPSPQSLQPTALYGDDADDGSNPHKKLTHTSSLSAPEVNRGNSPTQDHLTVKQIYQSSSLSRFDYVRRRQIIRMKKRSNWFLAPNISATSADSHSSFLGSRDRSVGRSSFDGTSSDALMSDVTDRSDGGMSDTHYSEGMRLSTEADTSFLDSSHDQSMIGTELTAGGGGVALTTTPASHTHAHAFGPRGDAAVVKATPTTATTISSSSGGNSSGSSSNPRHKLQAPDFINGNHSASSAPTPSPSLTPSPRPPSTPSHSSISEKDVRCFMVENWYGSPASQGSHS